MTGGANIISVYAEARRTGPGVALQIHHAHHQLEFNLVVSGRGTYFLDDGQHDLVPGTLCWLLPGQSHRLIRTPDFDTWVVTFDGEAFDAAFLEDVAAHPCRVLSTEDAVALDRLLSHISQDLDDPSVYRAGLEYAVRSARHASLTTAGPTRRKLHPAVLKALSVLRSNAETPSASALAKLCGVTQDYLGQLLIEQTGRGFVEWRNRTRLERFHILYPESGDLLTAALAAGFGSYTQFHRVFADLVGTTPGEWAKGGGHAKLLGLPADASAIRAGPGGSTRMVWYALCGAPLPMIRRRLGPGFAEAFLAAGPSGEDGGAIDSGADRKTDLRCHEPALIADLRHADEAAADKLARAFAQNDLFATYHDTLAPYQLPIEDLATPLALYVAIGWVGANHRSVPSRDHVVQVARMIRRALRATGCFDRADAGERRLFTAAVITQLAILRNALVGARASGNAAIGARVADAAQEAVRASLGIDLRATSLVF